ncbi:protein of unknown function (plasmid) [Azospirillum baldaniorum]|uniref:HMA domain-containing protein n=1 Tax=Azospirillum baldaniorum TaxID=1064539 RepID=A0A9P1NQY7_9PROT|nr:protein of unknown function [Azospirillum baldaniorum]
MSGLPWFLRLEPVHRIPGRIRLRYACRPGTPDDAATLNRVVEAVAGVTSVRASRAARSLAVRYDPAVTDATALCLALAALPIPEPAPPAPAAEGGAGGAALVRSLATLAGGFLLPMPLRLPLSLAVAMPMLREGMAIYGREGVNSHVLEAAAVAISLARRDFTAANTTVFMLALGEYMEDSIARRSGRAAEAAAAPVERSGVAAARRGGDPGARRHRPGRRQRGHRRRDGDPGGRHGAERGGDRQRGRHDRRERSGGQAARLRRPVRHADGGGAAGRLRRACRQPHRRRPHRRLRRTVADRQERGAARRGTPGRPASSHGAEAGRRLLPDDRRLAQRRVGAPGRLFLRAEAGDPGGLQVGHVWRGAGGHPDQGRQRAGTAGPGRHGDLRQDRHADHRRPAGDRFHRLRPDLQSRRPDLPRRLGGGALLPPAGDGRGQRCQGDAQPPL